jgi:hypothetical protein
MINPKQVFLGCSFKKRTGSYVHLAQDRAEQYGVTLVFGDNNPRATNIREQAFKLISTSRVVVLDIDPDNVNIAVEYGYAKGCGKRNIYLMTRKPMLSEPRFPSMLLGLQYKHYSGLVGFADRFETCLMQHYRRKPSVIDPEDAEAELWLQREILNLLADVGRATRKQIADALNCTPPDVTKQAKALMQQRKLGSDPSGPDTTYFPPTETTPEPA